MTTDEARARLHARQEAESAELMRKQAQERAALELALATMPARHRQEFIELGRRQIAERDFMATATPATTGGVNVAGQSSWSFQTP